MLAMHPEVLQKVRKEILDRVGSQRRPSIEDLREMKYLRAVINGSFYTLSSCVLFVNVLFSLETLRLFPPVPL